MNKMNKKGFTLIEMLVVIAIIAVLVAIIIPVVGNSTGKAQAATDAANLRSAQAALTIAVLDKGASTTQTDAGTATTYETLTGNKAPECKSSSDAFNYKISSTGTVTVKFGSNGIEYFAEKAGS